MIVQNAGGKGFEPDPLLDVENQYEARILGIIHVGTHQKQKHDGTNFIDEYDDIQQAIVEFEVVEDGTQVERGPEGSKHLENRRMCQFVKYSSHEKSGLFKLAQTANPKAAYVEKKEGVVDTSLIIGKPVSLELKLNKDGDKTNIKSVNAIPPKYHDGVPPLTNDVFQYSVMSGAHPVEGKATKLEDVPKWMLEFALSKALDAEQFTELEAMETHLEALEAAKDGNTELEGDRLPPKDKTEKKTKAKTEKKEDPKPDPEPEPEEGEEEEGSEEKEDTKTEESTSRRSRRSRRTRTTEDYSAKSIEDLEALVVEKELMSEDDLDDLSETANSDEEYKATLITKLEA